MDSIDLDSTQPPFNLLEPAELARLQKATDLVYFEKGERPITLGETSKAVFVIWRGRMQALRPAEGGDERLGDYGPGDLLGAFAVMMGQARFTYEALEQTLCFAIDASAFSKVQLGNARFAAWFLEALTAKRQMLAAQERPGELAETMLTRLSEAQLAPALMLSPQATLRDARAGMKRLSVSCALVADGDQGLGIVTRTDLLDALALDGMHPHDAIAALVRRPVLSLRPDEVLFQALVSMTEHHVERVVVADGDQVLGTVGMAELLSHYSSHSHLIGLQLARATRLEEVRSAALRMTDLVRSLHAQGARTSFLTELVSALNGRVLKRIWELTVPEPLRHQCCLLVLGSEGRREQIMKTDQDNALILPEGVDLAGLEPAMRAFSAELQACGWPPCPGGVMVSNPEWRHSVATWSERLQRWSHSTDPKAMLDFAITLDARPVAGDMALFEALRPALMQAGRNDVVLHHFAGAALAFHTPLTLFGNVKAGEHGTDVKKGGVFPLVHGLRALALRHGVPDRNSFRRAEGIAAAGGMSVELARDVQQALSVFLRLRLGHQIESARRGEAPDNYLRVGELRRLDRELLRDALAVVDSFKAHLKRSFHL
jgi:CBS domain-containing protein